MSITGRNRAQAAQEIEIDFTGYKPQDINFTNDREMLRSNQELTESFFVDLGSSQDNYANNSVFWENISIDNIFKYLREFQFNSRTAAFNNIAAIEKWCKEIGLKSWNVAAAGTQKNESSDKTWTVDGKYLLKANRSVKGDTIKTEDGKEIISIGVLRNPNDFIADFDTKPEFSNLSMEEIRKVSKNKNKPLLIVYRLNKNYEPETTSNNRQALNFSEDITALSIIIPGSGGNKPRGKKLSITPQNFDEDLEGEED